jgi:hypothetical protein
VGKLKQNTMVRETRRVYTLKMSPLYVDIVATATGLPALSHIGANYSGPKLAATRTFMTQQKREETLGWLNYLVNLLKSTKTMVAPDNICR